MSHLHFAANAHLPRAQVPGSVASGEARSNLLLNIKSAMTKIFQICGELIEDLIDLLYCFSRRNEPTIPFDEVIAELKRDGKLIDQQEIPN